MAASTITTTTDRVISPTSAVISIGSKILAYLETIYGENYANLTSVSYSDSVYDLDKFISVNAVEDLGLATFLLKLQDLAVDFLLNDENIDFVALTKPITVDVLEVAVTEIAAQNAAVDGGFAQLVDFIDKKISFYVLSGENKEDERKAQEEANLANLADCEAIEAEEAAATECSTCTPNENALVPNWTILSEYEPFLNERTCEYSIALTTVYTSTGGSALASRMAEYVRPGIEKLVEYYNKATTVDGLSVVDVLANYAVASDYYVDTRPLVKMKVLVTIPANIFDKVPDADAIKGEDVEDASEYPYVVTLVASELHGMLRRAVRALEIYGKYQAVWQSTGGGKINNVNLNEESKRLNLFYGVFGKFIKNAGYSFQDRPFSQKSDIENIEIGFDAGFAIQYVKVNEFGCEPISIKQGLTALKNSEPMNWPTTMAFIAHLPDVDIDITARTPVPWLDFVQKYVYPTPEIIYGNDANNTEQTILSCLTEDLANNAQQFGQELLDEVFSLPDAIAYAFNNNLCKTLDQKEAEDLKLKDIEQLTLQYLDASTRELFVGDLHIEGLPEKIAELAIEGNVTPEKIWDGIFNQLGACGLFALMQVSLECLLKGIDADLAIDNIVGAAIRNMKVDHLEKLFIGLPPDKQLEIQAKVQVAVGDVTGPWDKGLREGSFSGQPSTQETGTLGTSADAAADAATQAYKDAILDTVGATDLLTELDKLPGAELIAKVIAQLVDCPKAPLFSPPLDDFLKTLELDFCRNHYAITLPRFNDNLPVFDLMAILIAAAKKAIKELLMKILLMIMKKIIDTILNALCKALEITGELASAAVSGNADFRQIIRNSICGDTKSDDDIDAALAQICGALGVTEAGSSSDIPSTSSVKKLIDNVSSVLTQGELVELVNGKASDQTLSMMAGVIGSENPEFPGLTNKINLKNLFVGIGSLLDKSRLNDTITKEDELPAIPSLCATPESLQEFNQLRCFLVKQKGDGITDDQCEELFEKNKARALADLSDLSTLMSMGRPDQLLADLMPPMIAPSDGCSVMDGGTDGFLPQDSTATLTVASNVVENLFDGIATAHLRDLVGHRGFLDMVLSDVMGLGWESHNTMVRFFGQPLSEDITGLGFYSDDRPEAPVPSKGGGGFPLTIGLYLKSEMDKLDFERENNTIDFDYSDYTNDYAFVLSYSDVVSTSEIKNDYRLKLVETIGKGSSEDKDKGGLKASILADISAGGGENEVFDLIGEESLSDDAKAIAEKFHDGTASPRISVWTNFVKDVWGNQDIDLSSWAVQSFEEIEAGFFKRFEKVLVDNSRAFEYGFSPQDQPIVHILDPNIYGGSEANPPFYLEPPVRSGWMGLSDKLVPEWDACEPRRVPLCDFEGLKDYVNEVFGKIEDDERLTQNPDCVVEPPFSHIFDRMSAAAIEGTIKATLRIYACEAFLKGLVSFSMFKADFPGVYDDVLAAYIGKILEDGLIEEGRTFFGAEDLTYYYTFLEQIVQVYGRMIDRGDVIPGSSEQAAIDNLNQLQLSWSQKNSTADRKDEFERVMSLSLKDAEVILKAMLKLEIEYFAGLFSEAVEPSISSMTDVFFGSSDWILGAISKGGPLNVVSGLSSNPVTDAGFSYDEAVYWPFVLEKYLLIEEKSGETTEAIINRDKSLFGVVNIDDWTTYLKSSGLTGKISDHWQSWKIGLRLSYVPKLSDTVFGDLQGSISAVASLQNKAFRLGGGSLPLFPVLKQEAMVPDAEISTLNVGSVYDLDCLVAAMENSAEYETIFRYIFPLPRMLSVMTIYAIQGFLPSIGAKDDGWVVQGGSFMGPFGFRTWDRETFKKSKDQARVMFESFYNSRDFSYKDRKSRNATADLISSLRPRSNLDDGLRFFQKRRQRSRPYDKNGSSCDD